MSSTALAYDLTTKEPGLLDTDAKLREEIAAACKRIAPLWPLKHFVAVNPFLGFTGQTFAETCATFNRVARTHMLMPRGFYARAIAEGFIDDEDLAAALRLQPFAGGDLAALKEAARSAPGGREKPPAVVATVAETLDRCAGGDRYVSLVSFMIEEISNFCAVYFDEGQASWPLPVRNLAPYAAWRALAVHDRNAEAMGIAGFRACVRNLPAEPVAAIAAILKGLGIPPRAYEDYLFRALFDINGWAAYARYIGWNAELDDRTDDTLVELLAIRLAWGWALFNARRDDEFRSAWSKAMADAAHEPEDHRIDHTRELAIDLVLQEAYDIAYRRRLITRLKGHADRTARKRLPVRPLVQAAFCIDVRSEIFRRALETAYPEAETIGFAGFFGFPIEYVPIGHTHGGAQCPVLLKPSFVVCEAVKAAEETEEAEVLGLRLLRRRAAKAWKSFKVSAVSSFAYVETAGLSYAPKIVTDSLGATRPVPQPSVDGLDEDVARRVGPRLEARVIAGRSTGFSPDQKLAMAEAVLKAMSMTEPFARLVLLAGHGSTTVNNPHASGLDCGACGGHTGEANARVAAAILNDKHIRSGLAGKGIVIPEDCWFVGALHDTTTDEVKIFDEEMVPPDLSSDLARLKERLTRAASLARLERSALLGLQESVDKNADVVARSRDWSQVRPEWGLAGNAAFIAAPRSLTRGLDLGGRAFLHSYDHNKDESKSVLELIMTAPMVVASWINLQYYGSTVNNAAFGSGNKLLHNVVGQLGVLEGNAGDLRVGLPWQSVHDGTRFVHEPIRLNVFIAAPEAAIDAVLAKHASVRDLVTNGWVFLHAIDDDGRSIRRCLGPGAWQAC
ncbi:YbcC family protein [Bradyrhizobium sp.]|uniref:YbcC family protein n=1 Tax=Bradyrhizobium sp. TaxID=376 RepID=UPI00262F2C77|nr:DUF2309 domain-containing protein [Bradyrhizobium sp.]